MLLVPYKRFRIRTKLNHEQCRQKLMTVVQPQKVVPVVAVPDSADTRLIFKGQVKPNGFYLRYIDRSKSPARRNAYVAISGQLQDANGGTDIVVRAAIDPLYAIWLGFLSLSLGCFGLYTSYAVLTNPQAPQLEKVYLGIGGVLVFVWYVGVYYALFTYFFAKAIVKPCEAL
jgi:hypothetical protein